MNKKRKRRTTIKFREKHPRENGKFYRVSDANGGHPGRPYYCDPKNDVYFVQKFSTKGRKDRKKLRHNIDPKEDGAQWLIKKPVAIGYDLMTYESKYEKYRVHEDDLPTLKKYQKMNIKKK